MQKSGNEHEKHFFVDDKINMIHSNAGCHWNVRQFLFLLLLLSLFKGFSCVYISGQRLLIVLNKHDFSDFWSFSIYEKHVNMVTSLFCMSVFSHPSLFKTTNQLKMPLNRVIYLHLIRLLRMLWQRISFQYQWQKTSFSSWATQLIFGHNWKIITKQRHAVKTFRNFAKFLAENFRAKQKRRGNI